MADAPTEVIHIAGGVVQVGPHLRQRCGWCGACLVDMDLSRIAVPEGQSADPATWAPGGLVAVCGPASWLVEHVDGERLPDRACGQLDHEVTR